MSGVQVLPDFQGWDGGRTKKLNSRLDAASNLARVPIANERRSLFGETEHFRSQQQEQEVEKKRGKRRIILAKRALARWFASRFDLSSAQKTCETRSGPAETIGPQGGLQTKWCGPPTPRPRSTLLLSSCSFGPHQCLLGFPGLGFVPALAIFSVENSEPVIFTGWPSR